MLMIVAIPVGRPVANGRERYAGAGGEPLASSARYVRAMSVNESPRSRDVLKPFGVDGASASLGDTLSPWPLPGLRRYRLRLRSRSNFAKLPKPPASGGRALLWCQPDFRPAT